MLEDDVGSRLENFFWRIWGNKAIRDRIRGKQVAALFSTISEGGFIRTTPTQSPRNSRSIGNFRTPVPDRSPTTSPPFTLGPSTSGPSSTSEAQNDGKQSIATVRGLGPTLSAPVSTSLERKSPVTLPPILKKPTDGSSIKLNKSARIISAPPTEVSRAMASSGQIADPASTPSSKKGPGTIRFDENTKSSSPKAPIPTAQSSDKSTRPQEQPSQKSSRKKATFIVGAGPSKKRPVPVRQRSSQSSSSAASSVASPPPPAPSIAAQRGILNVSPSSRVSGHPTQSFSTRNSTSGSSHPTRVENSTPRDESPSEDTSEYSSGDVGGEATDGGDREENKSPLVDPNFRSKFVDKTQPPQRSFASLSSLAPKSTAVAAAPASYQAAGMMGFGQPTQQTGGGRNRVDFPGRAALAAADEDRGLTKTKSQLTLLLDKDRRAGDDGQKQGEGGMRRRSPP